MLLDLEGAPGTQPVQGALLQQQGYHVLGLGLHWPVVLLRPLDSVMDRVCERVLRRLACIILTNQSQLTNQRTVMWSRDMSVQRLAVPLSEDHRRCDVLRGPEHLVAELPGLPVNVALVQIGGQRHEPILLRPKSVSLMWPRAVIRRLSGFRSRCTVQNE